MIRYADYLNGIRMKNHTQENPAMLVYDSFRGHLEETVKKKFRDLGFDLAVIPGGLTSICQPLDVAINKPFKDNLRKEWHIWMAAGGAGETAAGNLRRARISDVCTWVKRSWEEISEEIIIESFKTCKISTDLDDLDSDLEIFEDSDGENNVDKDDFEGEDEDDVEDEDENNIESEDDVEDENDV